MPVKLAERPTADPSTESPGSTERPQPSNWNGPALGLSVRELDRAFAVGAKLPQDTRGVIVSRVEPMSPAFDASIERGDVLLEINRQPVQLVDDYQRAIARASPGDVLTFLSTTRRLVQRTLQTVRIE